MTTPITKEYIPGNRKVECDVCGDWVRFAQAKRGAPGEAHAGLVVCPNDDDGRHLREDPPPHRGDGVLQRIE